MRRLKFLGWEMALAVILSSVFAVRPAYAQDSKSKEADSQGWLSDLFGSKEKPVAKKKPAGKNKDAAKEPDSSAKSNKEKDEESLLLKREQAAYLRRLAVCDRLREVAVSNNDFALSQTAEKLEAQALAVYNRHIAHLKASTVVYQPDQAALDTPSSPETRRSAPSSSKPSAAGKTFTERSEAREEKP
jgi:hypothetical protein